MKKTLIVPYYGKFPEIFPFWIESCRNNPDIDWIIFTDIKINIDIPVNVKIVRMTFEEIKELFQKKFDFKISLKVPYKLCDFRATYGLVFEEYLSDSDFWGYCDIDTIWGKISTFLPDDIFEQYDKIFVYGHLSFIRNTKEINNNFKKYKGYKICFSSPANYAFDETDIWGGQYYGFTKGLMESGYKIYSDNSKVVDVNFMHKPFIVNNEVCYFRYENGRLYKVTCRDTEEVLYAHFQKRNLTVMPETNLEKFIIIPNCICSDYSKINDLDFWNYISEDDAEYFDNKKYMRSWFNNLVKGFIHDPDRIKSLKIWLKYRQEM